MHIPAHTDIETPNSHEPGQPLPNQTRWTRNRVIPIIFIAAALSGAASMNALGADSEPSGITSSDDGVELPAVAQAIADRTDSFDAAEQNRFQTLNNLQRPGDQPDGHTRAEHNRAETLRDLHTEWRQSSSHDRAEQNRFQTLSDLQQPSEQLDGYTRAELNRFRTLRDLFRS